MDRWILILNRTLKGPFTKEEIQDLLKTQKASFNDLALLVSEGPSDKKSWKFLWQYQEFDRRINPETPAERERREQKSKEKIENEVERHLPPEALNISPESLGFQPPKFKFEEESEPEPLPLPEPPARVAFPFSILAIPIGLIALGIAISKWRELTERKTASSPQNTPAARAEQQRPAPPTRQPARASSPRMPASRPTAPSMPVAPPPQLTAPPPTPRVEAPNRENLDREEADRELDEEDDAPRKRRRPIPRKATPEEDSDSEPEASDEAAQD